MKLKPGDIWIEIRLPGGGIIGMIIGPDLPELCLSDCMVLKKVE